jgi:hypothetical protein
MTSLLKARLVFRRDPALELEFDHGLTRRLFETPSSLSEWPRTLDKSTLGSDSLASLRRYWEVEVPHSDDTPCVRAPPRGSYPGGACCVQFQHNIELGTCLSNASVALLCP